MKISENTYRKVIYHFKIDNIYRGLPFEEMNELFHWYSYIRYRNILNLKYHILFRTINVLIPNKLENELKKYLGEKYE